jgi:hypothetical protein
MSSLGLDCKDLDGTYDNEGVVAGADAAHRTIFLTSILPVKSQVKGKTNVSIRVATRKTDSKHDTFAILRVTTEGEKEYPVELRDCYCVKGALFYSPSQWFVPILVTGGQRNVWLTKASDGSLIAKVWDYKVGLAVWPPIYNHDYVWARFKWIGDY